MDGIATIGARVGAIQQTLASLTPRALAPAAGQPAPAGGQPVRGGSGDAFAAALATQVAQQTATPAATPAAAAAVTAVPGLSAEQTANARAVVAAGAAAGLSLRDQAIGVMTAMGESSLRVLDRGDHAGPDSRGLFQQRDNGAWGTYAERMDPTASATSFFRALARVDGREAVAPTLVAHAVQRNADPQHYARYWDQAVAVVARLTGTTPAQVAAS
ncbi:MULTISPECIES: hypothetical protein [Cellulomonas]|uniref:hypothetical protein n=1 Tax=Cellulomonas TaxID=1707 RepID=UPI00165725F7|nr:MULTISPECIES: hypothetical protein [Cellulomonas]